MEFFSKNRVFNLMDKSKTFIFVSLLFIFVSYALLATKGLSYGIDFSGGTLVQVKYDQKAPIDRIREQISSDKMFANALITEFGTPDEIVIRFATTSEGVSHDGGDRVRELLQGTGNFDIRTVDIGGP